MSELITGRNPTLEDLGVKLIRQEDVMKYGFRRYKAHAYYDEAVGEFPDAPPPVTASERDALSRGSSAFL